MKKHIPNTITCCNLIAGCIATYFAFSGDATWALVWIIIGAVFDFFDGMTARLLGVSSPIGKELDSLADDITFGFAPSAIIFATLQAVNYPTCIDTPVVRTMLPYSAFIMAAFSAIRLAKFNLDTRQTTSFIGLPTPANALFWGSLIIVAKTYIDTCAWVTPVIIVGMLISCWLLVCELPMFALKFKHWGWRGNEVKYSFVVASLVAILLLGPLKAFAPIIACYVILSVLIALFEPRKPQTDVQDDGHS
ncbi:MAG: CDP-alcohol phosphatidyltransferase family protein [Prevotella sp.]|nr:CDP-alcohol phosphatidyltransferase family protein [Prevotella sp.]